MLEQRPANRLLPCVVRDLTFRANDVVLIDRLSLDLNDDGITVVLGPNGAGKSLMLRLLHGLLMAQSGQIRWGGRALSREVRMAQAMVFQRPILLRRSVRANIDFVLRHRGNPAATQTEEALRWVGLDNLAKRPARRLSGGEQQRLALARALALTPAVLFLDEPTANLDPNAIAMIEAVLRKANNDGTKVILVTHDLGQAKRLADDVVFMHRGRLIEQTPATAFFERPKTDIARHFIAGELITQFM